MAKQITPAFPVGGSQRLTDDYVRALPVPSTGTTRVWDTYDPKKPKAPWLSGFGVRLSSGGSKTFILRYRNALGADKIFTIGDFGVWSTEAGRDEAFDLKRKIKDGGDPLKEKQDGRDAPTVTKLADRFLTEHAAKKRDSTRRGYAKIVEKDIKPQLGKKLVAAIDRKDVEDLHETITKRGSPYAANRTVATLSKMFSLAVGWKWRVDNPCRGVARNAEEKRKRYLTNEELARLTKALAEYEDQRIANAIRLLLLVGARKGEVLGARWAAFDFERNVWTKRSSETKQNREHEVPLSEAALRVLRTMRKAAPADAVFLFPGDHQGCLGDIKKHWPRILQRARIADTGHAKLRIHDCRHSFASFAVSAGHSLETIGSLLGHSNPSTTMRYAHLHDHATREAANRVGSIMSGLVAKPPTKRKGKLKVVAGGKR
jgi:integrase